jgi:hypothetical protein
MTTATTDESDKIEPSHNDVFKGRGKGISSHPGNIQCRDIMNGIREQYAFATVVEKDLYAKGVLDEIQQMDPPGRFLSHDKNTNEWVEISENAALAKIRQALREGAPDLLNKKNKGSRVSRPTISMDHQEIAFDAARQLKEGQTAEEHIGMVSF